MKNILIICDNAENRWKKETQGDLSGEIEFDLLTLGIPSGVIDLKERENFKKIGIVNCIDVNRYCEKALEKIREIFPELVYKFANNNYGEKKKLVELLDCGTLNFWWLNKMSEKGAWGTPLIQQLYYIELFNEVYRQKKYDELWLELGDGNLRTFFGKNKNLFCRIIDKSFGEEKIIRKINFLAKLLFISVKVYSEIIIQWLILKNAKPKAFPGKTVSLFTFYPFFWSKSGKELFYQDLYSGMQKYVRANYVGWVTYPIIKLFKNRKETKKDLIEKDIAPLQSYISISLLLSSLLLTFTYFLKLIKYQFFLKCEIREQTDEGFDISHLLTSEFEYFAASAEIIKCVLLAKAIENYERKHKTRTLIYRAEFQPHEKALVFGNLSTCSTLGYQHQAIGRNHIQYKFLKDEISYAYADRKDSKRNPFPDYFLVTGSYVYELMLKQGIPKERLGICGPVRYPELVEYRKNLPQKTELRKKYGYGKDEKIFLIAAPVRQNDVLSFFLCLSQAFEGIKGEVLFLIKSHPVMKFDEAIKDILANTSLKNKCKFLPDNINLNDYIVLSDAVLLSGTTVGIESICLGTMPIVFENNSSFCLNPMLELKESCYFVSNAEEMSMAAESILNNKEEVEKKKLSWPEAVEKSFYDLKNDPNLNFINFMKEKGLTAGDAQSDVS